MFTASFLALVLLGAANPPFRIDVLDETTGRGVPLVEFETVNRVRYVSDSQGIIAIDDPELMGERVHFTVRSHGYEFPADGFEIRGVRLQVQRGGQATVRIKRINVAERLYRLTGAGIYRDSILVGARTPTPEPLMNARVLGSDSVQNAILGDRLLWFWGDTLRPDYPLGNFHTPGAFSALPKNGGLDPSSGVALNYWTDLDTGFASETARMPGEGPTWISGLMPFPEQRTLPRMLCGYVKVRPPMTIYDHGLAVWDEVSHRWHRLQDFPEGRPVYPDGHTFRRAEGDRDYFYFATPFPLVRVLARLDKIRDLSSYESFTCLEPGTRPEEGKVVRDADGSPLYAWRTDAFPSTPDTQRKLIESGALKAEEAFIGLRDFETGEPIFGHGGSVYWNEHRGRWVMICVQAYGKPSFLGEVWYAEADTPLGPWVYARRIVSHDDYSFYNPKHHPYFDQENGRLIYFEGTYTHTFSGNKNPTPRYDYNQIMYRLDLDDPRLVLPVPVYRDGERLSVGFSGHRPAAGVGIAFLAPDRPAPGLVPVYGTMTPGGDQSLSLTADGSPPLFHGRAVTAEPGSAPGHALVPLWEWTGPDGGRHCYRVADQPGPAGWKRASRPLVHVWLESGLQHHPAEF